MEKNFYFDNMFEGKTYKQWLKELNISYLGGAEHSVKALKSKKHGCLNYILYLAPSDLSGYHVCPNDKYCKDLCLNGSGQNKMQEIAQHSKNTNINISRIKKTRLFYENRELFMFLLIHEIKMYKKRAEKKNLDFAVRLNGTSDLSVAIFRYKGMNLLDIFNDVQFYDYTKVPIRIKLLDRFKNYDLTLSYNGYNWEDCQNFLENGGKVAVVFDGKMPTYYRGYKVNNANDYDMRYLDEPKQICGLTFHKVGIQYKDGKYNGLGDSKFVVRENDTLSEYSEISYLRFPMNKAI